MDRLFIAANVELKEDTNAGNAKNALIRSELLEVLARIALEKYGAALGEPAAAVRRVLEAHVLPRAKPVGAADASPESRRVARAARRFVQPAVRTSGRPSVRVLTATTPPAPLAWRCRRS